MARNLLLLFLMAVQLTTLSSGHDVVHTRSARFVVNSAGDSCLLPDHDQCAILPDVCEDASLSHLLCPHLCGFCASAVTTGTPQPTTTLPPTTTTSNIPPDWPLNEACTADAECATMLDKTVCFKGKCLCTPGLYYSVSTRTCITTCAAADLQTSYQRYRLAAIAGDYVGFAARQASPETCMAAKCTTTVGCLGFNWNTGDGYCALLGATASSPNWDPNYPNVYDFFQRNCA